MANPSFDKGGYRGRMDSGSLGRNMLDIQKLWQEEPLKNQITSLDALIATQLENAKKYGQKDIAVLDIGSGTANLFRTALRGVLFNTRKFLKDNPDFSVHLIGITDPAGLEEIGYPVSEKGTDIADGPGQTVDGRLTATNYAYTIDSMHTLSGFLQEHNIQQVHLMLATRTLMYFHPRIFKRTIEEVTTALAPEGRFIAHGYSDDFAAGDELSVDAGSRRGKPSQLDSALEQLKTASSPASQEVYLRLAPILSRFVLRFLDTELQKQDTDQEVFISVTNLQHYFQDIMLDIADNADSQQDLPRKKIADNIAAMQSALHLVHLVKLRRIKVQILDDFIATHQQVEVEKGNYLVSMVKKPANQA